MKIKPSVNKNVTAAVENCRMAIETEIIGLLKMMGYEVNDNMSLGKTLILYQTDSKGQSETLLANRVYIEKFRNGETHVGVTFGCDFTYKYSRSSGYSEDSIGISLSNLLVIYEEVMKIAKKRKS